MRDGRITSPKLGNDVVRRLRSCTTTEARSILQAAESTLPCPPEPPPPPPPANAIASWQPPRPPGSETKTETETRTTWPVKDSARARTDKMNVDTLLADLNVTQENPWSRNEQHSMRMRAARIAAHAWNESTDRLLAWHHHPGHPGFRQTAKFPKERHLSIPLDAIQQAFCDTCARTKTAKKKTHTSRVLGNEAGTASLSRFTGDVIGPFTAPSRQGNGCVTFFTSTHGTAHHCPVPSLKDAVFARVRDVPGSAAADLHVSPTQGFAVLTDNAARCVSAQAKSIWLKLGVTLTASSPHTPELNGRSEALAKWVKRTSASMLVAAELTHKPESWEDAINMSFQRHDMIPSEAHGGMSPHLARTGKTPDMRRLIHAPFCTVRCWRPIAGRQRKGIPGRKGICVGHCPLTDSCKALFTGDTRSAMVRSIHVCADPTPPPLASNRWFVSPPESADTSTADIAMDDSDTLDVDELMAEDNDTINVDDVLQAAPAAVQPGDENAHAGSMHLAMVSAEMTPDDTAFLRSLTKNKKTPDLHFSHERAAPSVAPNAATW